MSWITLGVKKNGDENLTAIVEKIINDAMYDGSKTCSSYSDDDTIHIEQATVCDNTAILTELSNAGLVANMRVEYEDDNSVQMFVLRDHKDALGESNYPMVGMWCYYVDTVDEVPVLNANSFNETMKNLNVSSSEVFTTFDKLLKLI